MGISWSGPAAPIRVRSAQPHALLPVLLLHVLLVVVVCLLFCSLLAGGGALLFSAALCPLSGDLHVPPPAQGCW